MTLQRLARWSTALALTASIAWAQEPTGEAASTSTPPADPSSTTQSPGSDAPTADAPKADEAATTMAAPTPPAPAEEARVLRGRIIDTKTKEALPAASVSVKGTRIATETDAEGRFTLSGIPRESFVLSVQEQDHQRRELRVTPDVSSITVELNESYVEEMVVIGRATEVARKNLANAVSTVSAAQLQKAPAATVDAALQGKVAGANIQANSGAPGGGMQIKLRGVSTINGQSAPLYVVDGVIISDVAISNGIHQLTKSNAGSNPAPVQDDQVNRIADLNPSDIANIEVLKGASAAAIYGSKASNGVVIITTKKGRAGGAPRIEFSQRLGTYQQSRKLGSRQYASLEEARSVWGSLADQFWTGTNHDHERQLAGRTDPSTETYAALSGSTGDTTYFASGLLKGDKGIIFGTGYDKQGVRLNLGHRLGEDVELNLSSNIIHSLAKRGLANNDNANVSHYMVLASTPSFINLQPTGSAYPTNPFVGGNGTNPLQTAAMMKNDEDVWRLLTAGDALWKIWKNQEQELKLIANFGVDRFQQKNNLLFPPELHFEPVDDGLSGTSLFGTHENVNTNLGVNLIHNFRPTGGGILNLLTTSAGVQQESRDLDSTYIFTRNFASGLSNVDSGTQVDVQEQRQRSIDRGAYVQAEALGLDERLQVVAAVRAEQSSLNGDPNAFYVYPKVASSYRLPGLPTIFDELKVRGAYGETGNLPLYAMKYTDLDATNNIGGSGGVLLLPGAVLGSSTIRPERQRELEAGVDALMFNGTTVVELTAYQRTISDLLLRRTTAPSTGYGTEIFNGGELVNRGVEAMVQVTPLQSENGFSWVSRTTFALNRSVIADLPDGVPPFSVGGFGSSLGQFRIEENQSATQIIGNDGVDATGAPIVRKIGDAEPDFRVSVLNDFQYGAFSLATNLEWQQGSDIINLTRFLYDLAANTPDYTTGGVQRLEDWTTRRLTRAYLEDATFLKIREVTLSYELPSSLFQGPFKVIRQARVSVSGRNLLTFTGYSGLDPEVSNFGNQPIARNIDVAPFPPSRSFWGSIDVGF